MSDLENEKGIIDTTEEETSEQEAQEVTDDELAQLKKSFEEIQNRLIRVQADFDNYRKRTVAEKEDLAKYVNGQLIQALLPAFDNFERAIQVSKDNNNFDSLIQGIEMVYRQFEEVLTNEGLKEIEAIGKPFNPEYHQAVMQVEAENQESGIIIEELQKGYTFKGKVIRPSMVKVSQ